MPRRQSLSTMLRKQEQMLRKKHKTDPEPPPGFGEDELSRNLQRATETERAKGERIAELEADNRRAVLSMRTVERERDEAKAALAEERARLGEIINLAFPFIDTLAEFFEQGTELVFESDRTDSEERERFAALRAAIEAARGKSHDT